MYKQSSQTSPTQSSTNSFHTALADSHQSYSTGQQFSLEFDGMAALNNLSKLEEARATLMPPLLEFEYSKTDCSQLTRHMWAHAKDQDFATKAELYSWVRNNWEIENCAQKFYHLQHENCTHKKCSLCMQERIVLFMACHQKRTPTHNFMNSKNEMYVKCSCRTRFLQLSTVGNEGADEDIN